MIIKISAHILLPKIYHFSSLLTNVRQIKVPVPESTKKTRSHENYKAGLKTCHTKSHISYISNMLNGDYLNKLSFLLYGETKATSTATQTATQVFFFHSLIAHKNA